MGDIGSCFIGMFSATIFAKTLVNGNFSNSILILAPYIPILSDTSITLLIRIKKKKDFLPHKKHAYQLLAQMGFSHINVSLFYCLKLIFYTSCISNKCKNIFIRSDDFCKLINNII